MSFKEVAEIISRNKWPRVGFGCAIKSPNTNHIYYVTSTQTMGVGYYYNKVQQCEYSKKYVEILKYNFFSSSVSYKNFPSTIIPNQLYDATKKEVYADFVIGETQKIKTDIIHHDDSTILYSVEENITNTLNQIQIEIKEKNSSTVAISSILNQYSGLKERSCFLIKENNKIEIIVIQDDQLILQNYFEVNSPTDVLYFTLFCFEQLKMDPNKNELYLIGNIEKGDETYSLLYDHIRNINFAKISGNLSFSKELNQIIKHQYFTLFSQILCV